MASDLNESCQTGRQLRASPAAAPDQTPGRQPGCSNRTQPGCSHETQAPAGKRQEYCQTRNDPAHLDPPDSHFPSGVYAISPPDRGGPYCRLGIRYRPLVPASNSELICPVGAQPELTSRMDQLLPAATHRPDSDWQGLPGPEASDQDRLLVQPAGVSLAALFGQSRRSGTSRGAGAI